MKRTVIPEWEVDVHPAVGLIEGTGCCQGCHAADQAVYVVSRNLSASPSAPGPSMTLTYLCRTCAHKVCVKLLELLCL